MLSLYTAIRQDHYQSRQSLGNIHSLSLLCVFSAGTVSDGITRALVRALGTETEGDVRTQRDRVAQEGLVGAK